MNTKDNFLREPKTHLLHISLEKWITLAFFKTVVFVYTLKLTVYFFLNYV